MLRIARHPVAQWLVGTGCSAVLVVALIVAGVQIAELTTADAHVSRTLAIILIACGVGFFLGVLPLHYVTGGCAAFVFAVLALTLVTGGGAMLVAAPVIRQMNTPALAEYRGFAALSWFGGVAVLAGVALAAFCLRWSMRREARRWLTRWATVLGSIYGVVLGLAGLAGIFALLSLINSDGGDGSIETSVVEDALGITTIAMFSLVPGVILTYQGISAAMGEGSSQFRPPAALFGLVAFGIVLAAGQLIMSTEDPIAAPMPVLHVLAAALPGLTYAAMAGRGSLLRGRAVGGLTWRQVTLAAAISMSVATAIAIYIEVVGSAYAIVLLLVHSGAFEFAVTSDDVFNTIEFAEFVLTENEQFAAGLITASILAPVSEEFGKGLSVRFMMRGNSTRAQCFLLGAIAGAAFGFLEGMSYGLIGIEDDLGAWWEIMAIRGGSTSLHVLCSGLTGVGWWYWSIGRQHRPALTLFGGAMLIHAAWNGAFTTVDSRIFVLDTLSNDTLALVAYSIVSVASVAMVMAIPRIAQGLRDAPPPSIEGTPLASMQAWLG